MECDGEQIDSVKQVAIALERRGIGVRLGREVERVHRSALITSFMRGAILTSRAVAPLHQC